MEPRRSPRLAPVEKKSFRGLRGAVPRRSPRSAPVGMAGIFVAAAATPERGRGARTHFQNQNSIGFNHGVRVNGLGHGLGKAGMAWFKAAAGRHGLFSSGLLVGALNFIFGY